MRTKPYEERLSLGHDFKIDLDDVDTIEEAVEKTMLVVGEKLQALCSEIPKAYTEGIPSEDGSKPGHKTWKLTDNIHAGVEDITLDEEEQTSYRIYIQAHPPPEVREKLMRVSLKREEE